MLPKQHRLSDDYVFRKLKKHGSVVHTPYFVMTYLSNNDQSVRVGFIASSKVGGAVKRHRATRVLREAVREVLPDMQPGHDVVLIAKQQILLKKTQEVAPVLRHALQKAKLLQYARMQDG